MAAPKENKSKPKETNPVVLSYLIAYNVAQVMGWSAMFLAMIAHLVTNGTNIGLYAAVSSLLYIFQTAAILEVVHCALGFVRSNVVLTAFQVASRVFLLWGVVYSVDMTQDVIGVTLFLFAWTVTEMIRYSFYTCGLVGEVPYILQWCRYTFFIVLYPIGVTGELLTIFASLDIVKQTRMYSIAMPNVVNMSFNYHYCLICIMLSYIPIFPQLYMHMIAQRKKVIGGAGKSKVA